MGKITPRFLIAVIICGLFSLSARTALANNPYGPIEPALIHQHTTKNFFVGFIMEVAPAITDVDISPASCSDANDGSISITVTGGTAPYTYSWTGPGEVSSVNSPNISQLVPGTYAVTVSDANGDTVSDSFTVSFDDSKLPVVLTKNISIALNTGGTAVIEPGDIDNGSSDNCGIAAIALNKTNFSCTEVGANQVSLKVTDINGNIATGTATVTVQDNIAPSLITQNITASLDASGNASIAEDAVNNGSSDACGGLTFDTDITNFDCTDIGENTVTLTVTDTYGNSASKTAIVTIEDKVAPSVLTQNITVQLDASGNASIAEDAVNNGSSDACGGLSFDTDITNFDCTDIGDNTVILSVTDNLGNSASNTAIVTVEDTIAPTKPSLAKLEWTCGTAINEFPTTTDNCTTSITGTTNDPLEFSDPGEYSITWTFTDPSGNSLTAIQEISIPEPSVEIPSVHGNAYCNTDEIPSITFTGNTLPDKTYTWSYETSSNIDIGLAPTGTGNIPAFTAKNNSSMPVTVEFTVIPYGGNCQGAKQNFTISINPTPSVTTPNDIVICEGETLSTVDLSSVSVTGSTVAWTNDNPEIGLSANGTGNIASFIATNDTNQLQSATISLTASANNCTGPTQTFNIEVQPKPRLAPPSIDDLCNGTPTAAISLTGNLDGITYDISGGSAIGLSDRTGVSEIPGFTPVNNTQTTLSQTIKITPKANGCFGEPIEIPVRVKPGPTVNATYSNQICSGGQTDIALNSPVANPAFHWTIDAPAGIEGATEGSFDSQGMISQQLVNTTSEPQTLIYNITPEAQGCTGTTIPVKITVNPTPDFEINLPECVTSIDLTDPAIKDNPAMVYSYWEDPEATIEVEDPTQVSLGTYYIKGQSNSGCVNIEEVSVEKIKPVLTNLDDAPSEICSGTAFSFLPESNLEETSISWSRAAVGENPATDSSVRNNINPNESLVNNTGKPITATYIFTLEKNACSNEFIVEVEISPAPQLIQEPISEICNGSSISYTPKSSLANSTITWERNAFEGNPAASGSGTIGEILYNDTGREIGVSYFITITSPKGCKVEESISFSLLSGPKVTASASKNNICAGETIDLNSTFEGAQSVNPVLLDENFNGATPNWQSINNSTGGNQQDASWTKRDGSYNMNYGSTRSDGSTFYISDSDAQGRNGKTRTILLYNQALNTIGYSSLELTFWQDFSNWNNEDYGLVEVSTDKSNWRTLETIDGGGYRDENVSVDLSGYIGQETLYVRFRYRANWGYWWAIDNVKITGEGSSIPDVTWTSSTNPDWTSNEPNPTNISVSRTTIFTATYTDPNIECPGVGTVEVSVKEPLQPEIIANYCSLGQTNQVLLSADGPYDSYRWVASGQTISQEESLEVSLAQTYTLYVTQDGCEASTSITPNENLIPNGDFEDGNTGFNTVYNFVQNDPGSRLEMYPEGLYAVGENAYNYHNNFSGLGHGGRGNFMIVNGDRSTGNIVWESDPLEIIPDTDYYFSAWTSNVNPASPARLRIQVLVNNNVVVESTLGDLTGEPVGSWINFYNPELWNSGNTTQATVRIINENPDPGGNDFGIDDISFAAFRSFDFEFSPENDGPVCEGETIKLSANLEGGRLPISFEWSGPDGFSYSTTAKNQQELVAADTLSIPNATVEMAGEYSLKITDFYGCNLESKTTSVTVIEKAVVFAGDDLQICSNDPVIDLSSASITHNTINSGFWTTSGGDDSRFTDPGSINTTYNPSQAEISAGEIDLILTADQDSSAVCEPVSDTINIVFNISPELALIAQDVTCHQGSNGQIEINIAENTGSSPFTYQWSDGQTGRIAENLSQGDYFVKVTDAKSCTVVSDTISIRQPEELIVGNPFEIQEASCFGDFGTVVGIPVTGGLYAQETVDPANIPYSLEILDSQGDPVSLGVDQVNYEIATQGFIVSGLQGGTGYTFLVSSSDNCAAQVKTFTTLSPPEINAGEVPEISECGVKKIWLSASPIDPEIGSGSWSYNNGETSLLADPNLPGTSFTGEPGETYTLTWSVASLANSKCVVSKTIEVTFPPSCSQLNFDGEDDYVDLGDHYDMSSSFSIEAWIKPHSDSGTQTIISKRPTDHLNAGFDLFLNKGAPTFRVNDVSVIARRKLGTDRWYHIAAVYISGSALKIYVDGIEIQTNTNKVPGSVGETNTPALIGAVYAPSNPVESKDHFQGFIEELRIWNTAISTQHIRFFMNQRLVEDAGAVSGTILGNNLNLPNAPETSLWNNLAGYYQLLAKNNLISDGYTDNLGSLGAPANGLLKNIQEMQENTAPLPYILYTDGKQWFDKTTWELPAQIDGSNINYRDVWNPPNSLGIDNNKIDWNIVKLSKNLENPGSPNNTNSIKLLGLIAEKGVLNMKGENHMGESQVGFGTGNALIITHYLHLDGTIDLNGESQLIQTQGSQISGNGNIERDQQGTASSYNYNYWSSPVLPTASSSTYKVNQVLHDGSIAGTNVFKPINFKWPHTHADGAKADPIKISDYWINAFRARKANAYSHWEQIGSYTPLKPGEGYTMKGTSGEAKIKDLQNYTFSGFPNNGTIEVSQIKPGQNYLLGNPYPSAISIEEFILDNISQGEGRNDKNLINGAVYFWDHFGGKTHYLAEYIGGYAVRNLLAGVAAISNDSRINATGAKSTKRAGAYIPVGQGFFVNTTQDNSLPGNMTDFDTGNIVFKNSQREFVMEKGQSFSFFLEARDNIKATKQYKEKKDSRYKIRLNFHSPTGYHREILVGVDARTSIGFDLGFDAPLLDKAPEDMYWVIDKGTYVIQGVPNFNLDQRIPLGISIAQEKEFIIEIAELENLPDHTDIFLLNKSDSTYHNLRKEAFKASLPVGEYQDLYEIVFDDVTTSKTDKEPGEGPIDYIYSLENREFIISNPELHIIDHINIYNIAGQLVDQHYGIPDIKEIHIPQKKSLSSAVYIVKVFTSAGDYAKKVIIRKN